MKEAFLERENPATRESPYVEFDRKDLGARAHLHGEIEVVLVVEGEVEAVVDGRPYLLTEGMVLIVTSGVVHSYVTRGGSRSVLLKLYADKELARLRLCDCTVAEEHAHYAELRDAICAAADEYREKRAGYRYAVSSAVDRGLMCLFRYLDTFTESDREEAARRRSGSFLADFDAFLGERYRESITLELAASEMHYSRYYFAHRFTEVTGQTFLEYVTLYRLERAAEALRSGTSVLDTALECGFGSVRSLHRAFKRHYGCAPNAMKGRE